MAEAEREEEPFSQLMERWCQGDADAASDLIARVLPWVRRHVRVRLGAALRHKDETFDIVQEALLEYLKYGQRFRVTDKASFRALLGKIVGNVLSDRHAWYTRKRRDMHRERARLGQSSVCIDPVGSATDPALRAERSEDLEFMRLALEVMQPLDRDVVVRHQLDGQTFEAIAVDLGLQPDAVRKRFHRALPRLSETVRRLRAGEVHDLLGRD